MTSLWLTEVPEGSGELMRLKAIREALRFFEPEADMTDAHSVLDVFNADGFCLLGQGDLGPVTATALTDLRERLAHEGFKTKVDLDPERYASQRRADALTRDGATPEQVFASEAPGPHPPLQAPVIRPALIGDGPLRVSAYETGQVLLTFADGNPLRAAAFASMLARTTRDKQTYADTIIGLMRTYPWLQTAVEEQGLMP